MVLLAGLIILVSQACAPRVKSMLVDDSPIVNSKISEIYVLHNSEILPADSEYVGRLKISDVGLGTDCAYDKTMAMAKQEAEEKGANIIEITKLKRPNLTSTCYRLRANLYYNDNTVLLQELEANLADINKSSLPDDVDYAVIHFYRPRYFPGSAVSYDIKINDGKVIGKMNNNSAFSYKTSEMGDIKIWSKDSEEPIFLHLKAGEEYFVKCTIKGGFPIAKPDMFTIENAIGLQEYAQF